MNVLFKLQYGAVRCHLHHLCLSLINEKLQYIKIITMSLKIQYVTLYPIHLSLCSDVGAYISDKRRIYARQSKFVYERVDKPGTQKHHARDN